MGCFRPLSAYKSQAGDVRIGVAPADCRAMELPCGRCVGCRMDRARSWMVRITHEAQLYENNLFVTLTYSPECLPASLSLEYPDFQGFMKRLRRRVRGVSVGPDGGKPIRFFVAGEYGGETGRPHYHAILFNVDFADKQRLHNGTFRSNLCEDLWDRGNVVIGSVTPESAAYVAGYCYKKQSVKTGHYEDVLNVATGEVTSRRPEFVVMSRRPGIGAWWYRRFKRDVLPVDHSVVNGKRYKVPRFYLEKFKSEADPCLVEEVLHDRFLRAQEKREDSTPERRAVREEYALRRIRLFETRRL